jgi:glycosyltransferase involved in cell wall biosynthesis
VGPFFISKKDCPADRDYANNKIFLQKLMKQQLSFQYNPFVSIALTTFNGENLLREQLDSLLAQKYQNFELVISDDGSEEATINILTEYSTRDSRIRWSRSPYDRGFIKNTENAIAHCKGEIIFLCDQDDVWFEDKVALHVDAYRDPRVQWVYGRFIFTDEEGKETGYIEDLYPDYFRHKTMLENTWGSCIGAAQTSYRAKLLHKVMPVPLYAPAHDSWIQLAIYPAKPYFIDKVLQTYRQHGANQVGLHLDLTPVEMQKRERQAIVDNMNYLSQLPWNPQLQWWKRMIFALIYVVKLIRAKLQNFF